MRKGALAGLVLLAACAPLPSGQAGSNPVSRTWLIGGWVPQGESCESDAGVRYNADGTWVAYESAGTWSLDGSSLLSVVTQRSADGEEVPLQPSELHIERIEALGPDAYRSRWADGTVMTLQRCPNWK